MISNGFGDFFKLKTPHLAMTNLPMQIIHVCFSHFVYVILYYLRFI
jgi:hypothetical protein